MIFIMSSTAVPVNPQNFWDLGHLGDAMVVLREVKYIDIPVEHINVTLPIRKGHTPTAFLSLVFRDPSLNSYMDSVKPASIIAKNRPPCKHITIVHFTSPSDACIKYLKEVAVPTLNSILDGPMAFNIYGLGPHKVFINGPLVDQLEAIRKDIKECAFEGMAPLTTMHITH